LLPERDATPLVKVRWLGHASFLVTAQDGTRWLSDPYEDSIGYMMPPIDPDFVTISHPHFDHASLQAIIGYPPVFDRRGSVHFRGHHVRGVLTYHDAMGGERWGDNVAFVVEFAGIRLAHLGDLGHVLTHYQRAELRAVDVLMIPVGGTYTLDAAGAIEVVKQLEPRIIIPMHYRTAEVVFPLEGVEMFANRWPRTIFHQGSTLEISQAMLGGESQVHVLNYS